MIVDYERNNFSVHQMAWNPNAHPNLVAIPALTSQMNPNTNFTNFTNLTNSGPVATEDGKHVSRGAIAGAAIAAFVTSALLVLLAIHILMRRKGKRQGDTKDRQPKAAILPAQYRANIVARNSRPYVPPVANDEAPEGSLMGQRNHNHNHIQSIPTGESEGRDIQRRPRRPSPVSRMESGVSIPLSPLSTHLSSHGRRSLSLCSTRRGSG